MKKATKFKIRPLHIALLYAAAIVFFLAEAYNTKHLQYSFGFVGIGGTFRYHNAKLLGLSLYQILILATVAISIGFSIARRRIAKRSLVGAILFPLVIFAVCFVGAKLLYMVECYDLFRKNGLTFDGLSLFGAIFITPLFAFLVSLFRKDKTARLLDEIIYYELIMLCAIRTGCFLQGCCEGITLWKNAMPIVLPAQLIEVFLDLLILDFCIKLRDSKGRDGRMFPWFMMLYGVARFLLEFIRSNPKTLLCFTNAQIFSVICFVSGLLLLKYFTKRK